MTAIPKHSRPRAAGPLALLLMLGVGGLLAILNPWGTGAAKEGVGVRPKAETMTASWPAAEELAVLPSPNPGPTEARVDAVELEPSVYIARRADSRPSARTIPGPSLTVQVSGSGRQAVTQGTVALVLAVDVREGKLNHTLDVRSALLASAPLNHRGQAIFETLPTMSNGQVVEVCVIAPGFEQRASGNQLTGAQVTLLPGSNALELSVEETEPVTVQMWQADGQPLGNCELIALPFELSHQVSKSDLRVMALAREGLRSGRPMIWQRGSPTGDSIEVALCGEQPMFLYCLDPEWSIEPYPLKPGGDGLHVPALPRPYLWVENQIPVEGWGDELVGSPDQLAARFELSESEGRSLRTLFNGTVGDQVWIRGLESLDLAVEHHRKGRVEALHELSRSKPELESVLQWRGDLFSGSLRSDLDVGVAELALLEEPQHASLVPSKISDSDLKDSVVRVLYPDGQDAPGTYAFRSTLGAGALEVGNDGHGLIQLVPGWGYFRLGFTGSAPEQDGDLWASDYHGWMITALNEGEAGSVTHAFVDRGTRLRVHPPADYEGRFAVRLSVRDSDRWRLIDESSPGAAAVDWARLPYGKWLVERLDEEGGVLDSRLVRLGRGRPAELLGQGELQPWVEAVAHRPVSAGKGH